MELKPHIASKNRYTAGLLIELYGIETYFFFRKITEIFLLIELYGIETMELLDQIINGDSFNRTIWN